MQVKVFNTKPATLEDELNAWVNEGERKHIVRADLTIDHEPGYVYGDVLYVVWWQTYEQVASELPF